MASRGVHVTDAYLVGQAGGGVKGLILKPGAFAAHIDGQPRRIHVSRDVVLDAYARIKAKLGAGNVLEMRLSHPGVGDMPLRWGIVTEVKHDPGKAEVWLAASRFLPEAERLLTDEARDKLATLGLSVAGPINFRARPDGDVDVTMIDVEAVDIVTQGAFEGSWITPTLPAGLAAQAGVHITPPPTVVITGDTTMPKLEGVDDIPADTRDGLTPEQQAVYVATYNAAIDEGKTPEEAHEAALAAATTTAPGPTNAEPENTMAAKAASLEAEVRQLRAELAAKKSEKGDLAARLAKAESKIGDLAAKHAALEAEKLEREAVDDVAGAIAAGKATPAEEAALLSVRRKLGHDDFTAMIQARGVIVPAGQKGAQPQHPNDPGSVEAAELVAKLGPDGAVLAGVHKVNPAVRAELVAKHAEHPAVRRALAADIKAAATKSGDA